MKRYIINTIAASAFLALASFPGFAQEVVSDSLGFRTSASVNPQELLHGQLPGVMIGETDGNPAAPLDIIIRGTSSIHSDNQPVWVVDGVVVSSAVTDNHDAFWQYPGKPYTPSMNPLQFLNSSEVESITVLKDASAMSLYGDIGAAGVIVVNTRMAEPGRRRVNISSNIGVNPVAGNTTVSHNHRVSFGETRSNTAYNISGTFCGINGIGGSTLDNGSLKANFRTVTGKFLSMGFDAIIGVGHANHFVNDNSQDYRALVSAYLKLNFTPFLSLKLRGGIDTQYDKRDIFYGKDTEFGAVSESNPNGGVASNIFTRVFAYNADLTLRYARMFAVDHSFSASISGQIKGNNDSFNTMNARNIALDILKGKSINVGVYPNEIRLFTMNGISAGGMASISYDYKNAVGANVSCLANYVTGYGRNGVDIYPAGDVWLDVHRMFFSKYAPVSALKLSAGYGETGKEKFCPYQLAPYLIPGDIFIPAGGTEAFYDCMMNLHVREFQTGLEMGFAANRVQLGVKWFSRMNYESFAIYRAGEKKEGVKDWVRCDRKLVQDRQSQLSNSGVEFSLKGQPVRTGGWSWILSANVSYVGSRIVAMAADEKFTFTAPPVYGGFESILRYRDFVFDILLDGAAGAVIQGQEQNIMNLREVAFGYNVPLRPCALRGLSLKLLGSNLTRQWRSVVLGVNLEF